MPDETQAESHPELSRDERLEQVLAEYLRQVEQGGIVDQQALLVAHPDLADDLREFFANHDRMKRLAAPLIESVPPHEQSTTVHSELAQVGLCIGPYTLVQKLGEGGMGEVWVAKQSVPVKRKVALKLIRHGSHSREVLTRFEHERQALAMMDHPNIAKVFDGGVTPSGQPYFVMELVNGLPLTKYCDEARLTPRERMQLFVPICQAVQHAHQKGIVHRDLKPSNILVTIYDGQPVPKVIDFGVAKATGGKLTDDTMSTQFGAVVGTLEYMSPEQTGFHGQDVDTRADIYSLGVILYELLTGLRPMDGQRLRKVALAEMIRVIQEDEPSKPSTRLSSDAGLPSLAALRQIEPKRLTALLRGELDWVVMKCLEKSRDRRYETVNGLARDIEHYLADEPVEARPPSVWYRFCKFARRNKAALAAATVVVSALCIATIGLAISNVLVRAERNEKIQALDEKGKALGEKQAALGEKQVALTQAQTSAKNAKQQQRIAQEQEVLAHRRFYAAQTNLAMRAWEGGDSARTLELLETQRPKFDQDDLRGFEWYYLWQLCHGGLRSRFNGLTGTVYSVVFLPDGKTLASANGSAIKLWDVPTAHEKIGWQAKAWALTISPDGKTLSSWGERDSVRLWDSTSGKQLAVFEGADSCTFSPDGKTVAVTRGTDVEFWDVAGKQRHSVLHVKQRGGAGRRGDTFLFAPDGKTALAKVRDNLVRIYRWDGANWQEGSEITGHGWFLPTAFSPDGKAFAMGGGALKIYAADTGKELSTLTGHVGIVYSVAFSPDGKSLASAGGDRTLRVWDLATGKQRTSYPHPEPVFSVAYSGDGSILASGGPNGMLRLWHAAPPESATNLRLGGYGSIVFSPDGKTLATSGPKSKLWDTATGQETATLETPGIAQVFADTGHQLAFSRDGKTLAIACSQVVELWNMGDRKRYAVLQGHTQVIRAVAFSPDGKTVATGSQDSTAILWDTATRQARVTLALDRPVSAVAFSPDGQTLATGSIFEMVELWDPRTGREVLRVQGHDRQGSGPWTWSVAFSPDGKTLAVASQTGIVRLWNPTSGHLRAVLQGHTACVHCVAFSPDGMTLATASADGTVRLWDTATGQEKVTLKIPAGAVAFSPDGSTLAVASADGVRLLRASQEEEAKSFRTELDLDEPNSPAALLDAAGGLKSAGRTEEAYQTYNKASSRLNKLIELKPDERLYWIYRASAFYQSGEYDKAIADYSIVIQLKPEGAPSWNNRASAYYKLGQWDKAVADCSKAIELMPNEPVYRSYRALSYAELGQWKEANADFGKAAELKKENPYHDPLLRYRQALARLPLGDVEGYRKLCSDMLGRFDPAAKTLWTKWSNRGDALPAKIEEAKIDSALWAVWTCVLVTDAVADWKVPLQLAQEAVDGNPKNYRALSHHGAALYRAGQFQDALKRLTKAEAEYLPDDKKLHSSAYNWLFLAMTQHRLGHATEAKGWLDKAAQEIDRPSPKTSQAAPIAWDQRLTLQLLRRETEELLKRK